MNKDEIKELITIMDEAELTSLRIVEGDKEIALERKPAAGITPTTLPGLAERVEALLSGKAQAHESAAIADDITDDDNTVLVRSPMVGTFYVAPSPDEEPFVKVGQEVITGQTMALVEAMKMMNEITATASGTVTEILAANGKQVEYDQPLFRIHVN